jgi:sterol desaturase/sphingolipid hydroxylase (fatty acid hydroxylase superfamily)
VSDVRDLAAPRRSRTTIEDHRWLLRYFASKGPAHVLRFAVPLGVVLLVYGLRGEETALGAIAEVALGVLYWTFHEWFIHRTVYHWTPRSPGLRRFVHSFHIYHHRNMDDPAVLNAGPALAVILTFALGLPVFLATQDLHATATVLFGTLIAYCAYEWTHWALHKKTFREGSYLAYMQRFHMYHHSKNWGRCFGVTNPLWDMLLGTSFREPVAGGEGDPGCSP